MERMYNRRGEIGRYGLKLKEVVKIFTSMETIRGQRIFPVGGEDVKSIVLPV